VAFSKNVRFGVESGRNFEAPIESAFSQEQTLGSGERSTGLGPSIVKNIVDAHGGDINVTSVLDEGTTFFDRLAQLE